jgi:hypothetical protein
VLTFFLSADVLCPFTVKKGKQIIGDVGKFLGSLLGVKECARQKPAIVQDLGWRGRFEIELLPVAFACASLTDVTIFARERGPGDASARVDEGGDGSNPPQGRGSLIISANRSGSRRVAPFLQRCIRADRFEVESPEFCNDMQMTDILFEE